MLRGKGSGTRPSGRCHTPSAGWSAMTSNELDRKLDAIARRQHGVFHRRQVIEVGFTRRMIEHRRSIGAWVTLAPSVYALASHPFTWLRQAKAAELGIPGAAVSHRAAAVLHRHPRLPPGRHRSHRAEWPAQLQPARDRPSDQRALHRPTPAHRGHAGGPHRRGPGRHGRSMAARADDRPGAPRSHDLRSRARGRGSPCCGWPPGARSACSAIWSPTAVTATCLPASELEAELYGALETPLLPAFVRQAVLPWWHRCRCASMRSSRSGA